MAILDIAQDIPFFFQSYHRTFKLIKADSQNLLQEVYKLRYKIYCFEHEFEEPSDFPDGIENDEYDEHSEHFLLIHKATEKVMGTVRVILPDTRNLMRSFPIQGICSEESLHNKNNILSSFEVSRLCISNEIRDEVMNFTKNSANQSIDAVLTKHMMPYCILGLLNAAMQSAAEHSLQDGYIVVEEFLSEKLKMLGIQLDPIGDAVEHHGIRYPFHVGIKHGFDNVKTINPAAWEVITRHGELTDIIREKVHH